jgi:hypothetical protein
MCKGDSLYNEGMKLLVYSEQTRKDSGLGWHRSGNDISYCQNHFRRELGDYMEGVRHHYTLRFTYKFSRDNDTVYFANSYPYTFADLNTDIDKLLTNPVTRE